MKYSKLQLLKILENTPRKGWSLQKIKDLVDSLWRDTVPYVPPVQYTYTGNYNEFYD